MIATAFQAPVLPSTSPSGQYSLSSRSRRLSSRRPVFASHASPPAARVVAGLRGRSNLPPTTRVRVVIDAPARNKRLIAASNLIAAPMHIVWDMLSDYDRLADHIPNLAMSSRRPHPRKGIRVEQSGSQRIFGFEFRAGLVMDMKEVNKAGDDWRAIEFGLVTSRDFKEFDGVWRMESMDEYKTALFYEVSVVPRGLVPVKAIEWRISEDVPGNMDAVRVECERRRRNAAAEWRRQQIAKSKSMEA